MKVSICETAEVWNSALFLALGRVQRARSSGIGFQKK